MKKTILTAAIISALAVSCTEKKETTTETQPAAEEVVDNTATTVDTVTPQPETQGNGAQLAEGAEITVKGKITAVNNGKDGYTATITMADGTVYLATISIPNMKDPKQYKRYNVGDVIKVKGKTYKIEQDMLIKVEELSAE